MKPTGKRCGICLAAALLLLLADAHAAPTLITYLRNTVFGEPLILKNQQHAFDPEAGAKWRKEFVRLNGPLGYKLIERQGKGEELTGGQ